MKQTLSVRACARTRTRAGAAIFVHLGAGKCSEICVRVRVCTPLKCADVRQVCGRAAHVRTLFFGRNIQKILGQKKF